MNQLRKWRQEFERENALPNATPPPLATEDLEQLRREIARLRIENETLKKAAIYFARESLEAPLHRGPPAPLWREGAVRRAGGVAQWLHARGAGRRVCAGSDKLR